MFLSILNLLRFAGELLIVIPRLLIGIRQAAHARHYAKHVVVRRVDVDSRGRRRANRVVGHREEQRGVINAR